MHTLTIIYIYIYILFKLCLERNDIVKKKMLEKDLNFGFDIKHIFFPLKGGKC